MKYLIRFFAISVLFSACSGGQTEDSSIPEDLAGKKQLLKEKEEELRVLTDFIAQLKSDIGEQDPQAFTVKKKLVTTSPIERKDFAHFIEIQGAVDADDLVDATSEVSGRIIKLNVKEGQNVRAGQLIAKLDLEQVNKQIAELEKSLELATTVFERQSRLWEQNIGSEIQFLEAKNQKERLEKSLETLQFQLTKSDVHAPISGVVENVVLQGGEVTVPGQPIVQILNTNKLKVVANVPENYLQAVRVGEMVTIKFPALNKELTARISMIGRTIDPANRTFKVEVNIGNQGGLLKPNLLSIMLINDYTEEDVVIVPLETVQEEVGGKNFLFIKETGANGPVAKKVYVKTGKSYAGDIIITQGLTGEEEIILDGARGLAENENIEIQNAKKEVSNG